MEALKLYKLRKVNQLKIALKVELQLVVRVFL